jgi:prolyl 4-hydroxylase
MSAVVSALLLLLAVAVAAEVNEMGQESYDIDSSWAIHSTKLADTFGNKQALYDEYMDGCRAAVPETDLASCNDDYRVNMNLHQPSSMRNYTRLGFKKIKTPERVFNLLKDFWERNKDRQYTEWNTVNVYHNMWSAPPSIVDLQNKSLPGGGHKLRQDVWDAAKEVLEEWTGQKLAHCSIWGIRVYKDGSILAPHVDRNPLVSSAIINVAQDVREPWPLEVWGHDGKPYNITMEPGEMVLYESHSLIHGRPFPLQGSFYANVFVHYEVVGSKSADGEYYLNEEARQSREAGLPPYIIPGSVWAEQWYESHPKGWELMYTPIDPQRAAMDGDVEKLKIQAFMNKTKLFEGDENDWQPIHVAARAGKVEVVDYLLKNGADVDAISNGGRGWTPLRIAMDELGEEHEVCSLLRKAGGHAVNMQDQVGDGEL